VYSSAYKRFQRVVSADTLAEQEEFDETLSRVASRMAVGITKTLVRQKRSRQPPLGVEDTLYKRIKRG